MNVSKILFLVFSISLSAVHAEDKPSSLNPDFAERDKLTGLVHNLSDKVQMFSGPNGYFAVVPSYHDLRHGTTTAEEYKSAVFHRFFFSPDGQTFFQVEDSPFYNPNAKNTEIDHNKSILPSVGSRVKMSVNPPTEDGVLDLSQKEKEVRISCPKHSAETLTRLSDDKAKKLTTAAKFIPFSSWPLQTTWAGHYTDKKGKTVDVIETLPRTSYRTDMYADAKPSLWVGHYPDHMEQVSARHNATTKYDIYNMYLQEGNRWSYEIPGIGKMFPHVRISNEKDILEPGVVNLSRDEKMEEKIKLMTRGGSPADPQVAWHSPLAGRLAPFPVASFCEGRPEQVAAAHPNLFKAALLARKAEKAYAGALYAGHQPNNEEGEVVAQAPIKTGTH